MRSLDYARDDTLRDGALKKSLSFRTVFREESHRVKQRSTKLFRVILRDEALFDQMNQNHLRSAINILKPHNIVLA